MQRTHRILSLLCGCALGFVAGCHYPYQYNPYGYGHGHSPYGGVQGYPAGTVPGPGFVSPAPNAPPYEPGGTGGFGTDSEWSPSGGSSGDGNYFDDNPVPDPRDGLGDDPGMFDDNDSDFGEPADSFGSVNRRRSDDQFAERFRQPTVAGDTVSSGKVIGPDGQPQPAYGFDRESYQWLRGLVGYDTNDRAWHIIYSMIPDKLDDYGGNITLARHPQLAKLRQGDFVEVEGEINLNDTDDFGKPRYRISRIRILDSE